ncbi:tRNA (adenosine(37)-N6)-threonylcarbamoyltransferase complex dimerization subunit type 1 TsaB [Microbacterium album]|uniref:tRNA (Adenosine(37)-N6)-threonylcarbamoyltransferase complex dimerization subunit type 1 TsaB n=1 Tax=Microbacterium album TaxID=2053191 RepID=A0A917MNE5_9MICO|nr:tRNA (adenosine(37)-N6)-threonylcarbamoyltransferase complex dimerization subunit type 1 TsaB [Microbacterium album]GGH40829.1 tRNA (adenosine(37)-N6)-threonylcarbamoyltransferase complex dimerization subunit type 1 TsaB [Microbacterium album]
MILAIDTSIGSTVAVVEPSGDVRSLAESADALGHAEIIGELLERALAEAGIPSDGITHVAAGMGPGPFTGLRIGIAAARAFALGRGIPVVPVASHTAAALRHIREHGDARPFAIVTDARRRENAVSVYAGTDEHGLPRRVAGPELRPRATDLAADPLLADRAAEIVEVGAVSAADVGRVAALALASRVELPDTEPLYLRSPDVTLSAGPKRVSA